MVEKIRLKQSRIENRGGGMFEERHDLLTLAIDSDTGFCSGLKSLHELAHRRQINYLDKFWQEVERLCPDYMTAERWLKVNRVRLNFLH